MLHSQGIISYMLRFYKILFNNDSCIYWGFRGKKFVISDFTRKSHTNDPKSNHFCLAFMNFLDFCTLFIFILCPFRYFFLFPLLNLNSVLFVGLLKSATFMHIFKKLHFSYKSSSEIYRHVSFVILRKSINV